VAIKIIPKRVFKQTPKLKALYDSECNILKKINNPNVVKYIDDFETVNNAYLVLEYCNEGDMEEYMQKKKSKRIPEEEAKGYFY
jgi:serine/threonine protein kinase